MRWFIIVCFFVIPLLSFSKGIVIADEKEQLELFGSQDSTKIISFVEEIAQTYSNVILHLGNEYVFRRGNIFYDSINQVNLIRFARYLKQKNVSLHLWFLDSYGSISFEKIFLQHKKIIDETALHLNKLNIPYDGIYIDLEWINRGALLPNNENFETILIYLEKVFSSKKIGYFCSLIDSEKENERRGYTWKKLKKFRAQPLVMLYVKDGAFYVENEDIVPYLNEARIRDLKAFYVRNKWNVCVSMSNAWIANKSGEATQIKVSPTQRIALKKVLQPIEKQVTSYYVINKYQFQSDYQLSEFSFKKQHFIWEMKVNSTISEPDNFLWEYYLIKEELQVR